MPYCATRTMPQTRGKAMQMLILEHQSIQTVANHFGVNRTTIWRWYKKWQAQNQHIILHNTIRRKDAPTSQFRLKSCKWSIPTGSAAPLQPHCLSEDIVQLVLDVRGQLKRCAEVVWYYINYILGVSISLSSVCRILKRHGRYSKHRKKSQKYKGLRRPDIQKPGDLVEIDTIHLYNLLSGERRYIYAVLMYIVERPTQRLMMRLDRVSPSRLSRKQKPTWVLSSLLYNAIMEQSSLATLRIVLHPKALTYVILD